MSRRGLLLSYTFALPCSNTVLDQLAKRMITGLILGSGLPLNLAYSSAWMQCRNWGLGIIPDHVPNLI